MVAKSRFPTSTEGEYQPERHRPEPRTVTLSIKGLHQIPNSNIGGDEPLFELEGVVTYDVDWAAIGKVLADAGMDERDSHIFTEEFAEELFTKQLAKTLAKRIQQR